MGQGTVNACEGYKMGQGTVNEGVWDRGRLMRKKKG